jgi:DNA-binding NarL/FixJ family response regulator
LAVGIFKLGELNEVWRQIFNKYKYHLGRSAMEMSDIHRLNVQVDSIQLQRAEEIAKKRFDNICYFRELTARESLILQMLMKGLTIDEICQVLGTSHSTVRSQQQSIFQKLGVSSALQAVVFMFRRGLQRTQKLEGICI